jgi:hypothetical protein
VPCTLCPVSVHISIAALWHSNPNVCGGISMTVATQSSTQTSAAWCPNRCPHSAQASPPYASLPICRHPNLDNTSHLCISRHSLCMHISGHGLVNLFPGPRPHLPVRLRPLRLLALGVIGTLMETVVPCSNHFEAMSDRTRQHIDPWPFTKHHLAPALLWALTLLCLLGYISNSFPPYTATSLSQANS